MELLVLGGTRFIGREVVAAALDRGDRVTIVHRGLTGGDLFDGQVERVLCDRVDGLGVLAGRAFDAVIDTSCRLPQEAAHAVEVLGRSVGPYVFLSTGNVYATHRTAGIREDAPLCDLDDAAPDSPQEYGALKAVAERLVLDAFGERATIARSGLIVGPNDYTGRFLWWVDRVDRGGRVLAPEPQTQPVQVIDVRDLAAFLLTAADGRIHGVFNVAGPAEHLDFRGLLDAVRSALDSDATFVWTAEQRLRDAGVQPWSDLPLWLDAGADPEFAYFMALDNSRALAAGLTFRPLAVTVRDTLAWLRSGNPIPDDIGLSEERERAILDGH